MKLRALLLTNNEVDILRECVCAARAWADEIHIFDTGSTDNTLEIINSLALEFNNVHLFRSEYREFDWWGTAAEVYRELYDRAVVGDWWCIHSTDEIYIENPKHIISKVGPNARTIWSITLNYYFTEIESESYKNNMSKRASAFDESCFSKDLRHYIGNYSEPRFFKHFSGIDRSIKFSSPSFCINARERVLMKHLQYRTPEQIVRRVESRAKIFREGGRFQFMHEADFAIADTGGFAGNLKRALSNKTVLDGTIESRESILQSRTVNSSLCQHDRGDGFYIINQRTLPIVPLELRLLADEIFQQIKYRIQNLLKKIQVRLLKLRSN